MCTLGRTAASLAQSPRDFAGDGESQKPRFIYPSGLLADPTSPGDANPSGASAGMVAADSAWWLIYTKSRQEKKLSEQLLELRVPHFLPVHQREAVSRGRIRLVEEPLFSGYLFLCADDDQRRAALTTNRISTTHRVEDARRLRYELAQIAKSIAGGARLTLEAKIEPGDWVRVKSGLHEGLEGMVIRRHGKTRLLLAVDFLQQGASLEIHDSLLELIAPPRTEDGTAQTFHGSFVEDGKQRGR